MTSSGGFSSNVALAADQESADRFVRSRRLRFFPRPRDLRLLRRPSGLHRAPAPVSIKVRAVAGPLIDEQLVVAQGQENKGGPDLPFIEPDAAR